MVLDESSGVYAATPGKYDFLDCPGIQKRTAADTQREAELTALIDRANQSPSGTVVSALVYKDQINMVRSDKEALVKAADDKRCAPDLKLEKTNLKGDRPAGQPIY